MENHRPIDKGYSWVVLAVAAAINYFVAGSFGTMSVLLVELLHIYPNEKVLLAWTTAVHVSIGYITSVPISWCIVRYGRRLLGISSGALLSGSFVLGAVIREPVCQIVSIGCIGGISAGFLYNICILSVQKYFMRKWLTSQGLLFSSLSLGFLTYPLLMRTLTDQYSWYGAMLLHAGLLLHVIPCCMLLKEPRAMTPRTLHTKDTCFSPKKQQKPPDTDCQGLAINDKTQNSKPNIFGPIIDHPAVLLCLLAVIMTQSGFVIPVLVTPLMADHIGSSKFLGALLISVAAAISLVCRTLFGYTGDRGWLNQTLVCGCAAMLGGILTISIYFINSYLALAILVACIAVPSSIFMSTWAATVVEIVDKKHVPLTLGYGTMSLGLGDMCTLGMTGFILQTTGNPRLAFLTFGLVEILGGLTFISLFMYEKLKSEKPSSIKHKDIILGNDMNS